MKLDGEKSYRRKKAVFSGCRGGGLKKQKGNRPLIKEFSYSEIGLLYLSLNTKVLVSLTEEVSELDTVLQNTGKQRKSLILGEKIRSFVGTGVGNVHTATFSVLQTALVRCEWKLSYKELVAIRSRGKGHQ